MAGCTGLRLKPIRSTFRAGNKKPLVILLSVLVLPGIVLLAMSLSSSSYFFPISKSGSNSAQPNAALSPTSHGATILATNYNFYSTAYNTYVYWSQTIYADSVSYFSDHLNFTNGGFANSTSPSWTFGTGAKTVNLTISQITSNLIELDDSGIPSTTAYVFFYFVGSSPVTQVNSIPQSSFLQNYTAFLSCAAPCVYLNQSGQYVEVSNPSGVSTQNLIHLTQQTTTTTSTSTSTTATTSSSTTTTSTTSITTSSTSSETSTTVTTSTATSTSQTTSSSSSSTTSSTSSSSTSTTSSSKSSTRVSTSTNTTTTSTSSPSNSPKGASIFSLNLLSPLGDAVLAYLGVLSIGAPVVVRAAKKAQGSQGQPQIGWRW